MIAPLAIVNSVPWLEINLSDWTFFVLTLAKFFVVLPKVKASSTSGLKVFAVSFSFAFDERNNVQIA